MIKEQQANLLWCAHFVLNSGLVLLPRSKKDLEAFVARCGSEQPQLEDGFNVFVQSDDSPSLWGDAELSVRVVGSDTVTDDVGDSYRSYRIECGIMWSSFNGSCADAITKLKGMTRIAQLASEIASEKSVSDPIRVLHKTAAQRLIDAEVQSHTENTRRLRPLLKHVVKGMRVFKTREVDRTLFSTIPDGDYIVMFNDSHDYKAYKVRLKSRFADIYRTQ